jgi:hypothetical protein
MTRTSVSMKKLSKRASMARFDTNITILLLWR